MLLRQWRDELILRGSVFILLFAVLPNVLYVGHWSFPSGPGDQVIHTEAKAEEHAAHCHIGPSNCANQQSFVGTWWVGEDPLPISLDGPTYATEPKSGDMAEETALPVDTPPPRGA